ncbi:MAG: DUF4390 domain-containing protein [Longimicrobiales bacterium]
MRRVRLATALLALGSGAPGAVAVPFGQTANLAVRPDTASDQRALLRIGAVLDDSALEEATRSGLPVRVRARVELWRDGFFDDLEATANWNAVLLYEPLEKQYIVRAPDGDAQRFTTYDRARAAVEREIPLSIRPVRTGRYYYLAHLEIETLSLSDLEELERWLQGELGPAVGGDRSLTGAVSEGAKRLLIRLLGLPARRVEARSDRFEVQ